MKTFKDLDSLWKYAQKEIKDVMKNEVIEAIKDVEQEVIQEVVLDAYEPAYYDRRSEESEGKEGLISRENMIPDYVEGKDYIEVNVTNDTRGDTDYPGSTNDFIDEIIEYGTGYTWTESEIYKSKLPRPFTAVTQERIDNSGIVEKIIKNKVSFEIK